MIHDKLENFSIYPFGLHWERAFEFIRKQDLNSCEMKYELEDGIYAVIESYKTKQPSDAILESHRKYVDIQWTIAGAEQINWFSVSDLKPQTTYNTQKDVIIYDCPKVVNAQVSNFPGFFSAFWPNDAHMPMLKIGTMLSVKKGVVKIPFELLRMKS